MNSSDPRTMLDSTGSSRPWEQTAPWDHGLDEVLGSGYFDRNYAQFRERDRIEVCASDLSWICGFLVVGKSLSARTVATLLTVPPVFLLQSADRSEIAIVDQLQKAENAYRANKMGQGEYEARRKVLESLRDHGRYPSAWLADKLAELNKALDAKRLTKQQHHNAAEGLFAVMTGDQMDEVNGGVDNNSGGGSKAKKGAPAPVSH